MGATESRPRETRGGGGEEEIAVAVAVVVGLGVAVAAVRLGVAAWNAMRRLGDFLYEFIIKKRTFEFKVDGSIGEDLQDPYRTKKAGSGGVLRNEKGEFLCEFYQHLGEEADITAAEVTAIKGALEVFSNNKFKWVGQYDGLIVANDNDTAVRLAKGEQDPNNDQISDLVDEIKKLVSAIGEVDFIKVDFIKVDREDLDEADKLAKRGRKHLGAGNTNRRVVSYMKSF